MKLPIHKFAWRILLLPDRHFVETPLEPGPRNRVANFIADIRKQYAEKKKNLSPNEPVEKPDLQGGFSCFVLCNNQ